jgi:hypothetical protein
LANAKGVIMATVNMKNIAEMALDLDEIGVFLYWLYRDVPSQYARTIFFKIQYFFVGDFLLTDGHCDLSLRNATDYTLRFIFANPIYPGIPPHTLNLHSYRKDMADALFCFHEFCQPKDIHFPFDEQTIRESRNAEIDVGDIVDKLVEDFPIVPNDPEQKFKQTDVLLLNFNMILYKYIQEYRSSGSYIDIPKDLIVTLKDLIAPILKKHNLYIPESESKITRVFEVWTESLWENTKKYDE